MTREQRALLIFRRWAVRVGRDVPPGTGLDARAWAAVEGPSRRALDAERAYLAGGEEADFVQALEDVRQAWIRAGEAAA